MLFKYMNFLELFQTGCIGVTFIPANENHKSNDFCPVIFPNPSSLEKCLFGDFSENFRKLAGKNSMMEFIFSNVVGLSTAIFLLIN